MAATVYFHYIGDFQIIDVTPQSSIAL